MIDKRYIAEFIGTFALVFCGTGAMVIDAHTGGGVTHVGIGLTFGFIVMGMIYAFGDISGAHINPAVTIAFAFAKKFPWSTVPYYCVAQLLGAGLASALLLMLFPLDPTLGATLPHIGLWQTFVLEFLLTFFLMLVIINVSTGAKEIGVIAGLAIGGMVLLAALFAGPVTGASMNPARSIAPALWSGNLDGWWIYILSPIAGALFAVQCCKWVKFDGCCDDSC